MTRRKVDTANYIPGSATGGQYLDTKTLGNMSQGEFFAAQIKRAGLTPQGLANRCVHLTLTHVNGLINEIYFITPYVATILSKVFPDVKPETWMGLVHKDQEKEKPKIHYGFNRNTL